MPSRTPLLAPLALILLLSAGITGEWTTAAASVVTDGVFVRTDRSGEFTSTSRPKPRSGKVRVTVRGPKGLPATLSVGKGKNRRVVTKSPRRAAVRKTLSFRAGQHLLRAKRVVFGGKVLEPSIVSRRISVRAGMTRKVSVHFRPVKGLAEVPQLTQLTSSTIGLRWKSGRAAGSEVRLTEGSQPAMSVHSGRAVRVTRGKAVATNLRPGATYTLSVFTRVQGSWRGPVPLTAGTVPAAGSPGAEFVAAANTFIGDRRDVLDARATEDGVGVRFRGDAPLIGSAVVLPPSPSLPHGYVGEVVDQSISGTTRLEQASLSDAFDYLSMQVPDLGTAPVTDAPAAGPGTAHRGLQSLADASCTTRPKKADDPMSIGVTASADNLGDYAFTRTIALSEKGLSAEVGASVDVALDGSFAGEILAHSVSITYWVNKKKTVSVPYGATIDGSFGVTGDVNAGIAIRASKDASKASNGSYDCALTFPRQAKTFMAGPVPLTVTFEVKAQVGISGVVMVEHVGATVGTMVDIDGGFGPGVDDKFTGSVVPVASLHAPTFSAEAAVEASASATLSFGPGGAADDKFGAMAGIEGTITPLKLGLKGKYHSKDKYCGQFTVGGSAGLDLLSKVWYHGPGPDVDWESSRISLLPQSAREWAYFNTDDAPVDLPEGCADESAPTPTPTPTPTVDPNDRDGDGLSNALETANGYDPDDAYSWRIKADVTDPRGVNDFQVFNSVDTDGDQMSDYNEVTNSGSRQNGKWVAWSGQLDWHDPDTDGDGLSDREEWMSGYGWDPTDAYSWAPRENRMGGTIVDHLGVNDYQVDREVDTDGDNIMDYREVVLSNVNGGSFIGNLDWHETDTDADGVDDRTEWLGGTDPTDPSST